MSGSYNSKFGYVYGTEDTSDRLNAVEASLNGKVNGEDSGTVVDNAIVRWDSTDGKNIQNSSATIDDSGNVDIIGYIKTTDSTASSSTSTGSLIAAGGAGIAGTVHCNDIVTNNVLYNSEVITDISTAISTTIRTTIIDLTTPLGFAIAKYETPAATSGVVARLATATHGTRKTIILQEGQTDWITIETATAAGGYPWVRYFLLTPSERVLHLKYETDHWEQDSQSSISEYLLHISDHNGAEISSSYARFSSAGDRYVFLDYNGTDFRELRHYTIENNDTTLVETIDLVTLGCFSQTFNTGYVSIDLSYDGTVMVVGNKGNGTTDSGEVAVFNLESGVFVHKYTFVPSVPNLNFGNTLRLSADGLRLAVSDNTKMNIYTINAVSETQVATFSPAGGTTYGVSLSGDGHWAAIGEITGGNVLVYSDLGGSWALIQTITGITSSGSDVQMDYYGRTLLVGQLNYSGNIGVIRVYFRLPGVMTSTAFTYLHDISLTASANYYSGSLGYFNISDDGLTLAVRNRWKWGVQRRASLQENFIPISESSITYREGAISCSPKGDYIGLTIALSSGNTRFKIYKSRRSDQNLNLLDSSQTNNLALIKGDGHLGGDLTVTGSSYIDGSVFTNAISERTSGAGITFDVPILTTNINSVGTGNVNVITTAQTGATDSGDLVAKSGTTVNGVSGDANFGSGDSSGTGDSGHVNIGTGSATGGVAGNITLSVGGTSKLQITPTLTTSNQIISCSTVATSGNHLTNKTYVDTVLGSLNYIGSSTFTPSVTAGVNVSSVGTLRVAKYSRIGDIITGVVHVDIVTAGAAVSALTFTLPATISYFTSYNLSIGTGTTGNGGSSSLMFYASSSTGGTVIWNDDGASTYVTFSFHYCL